MAPSVSTVAAKSSMLGEMVIVAPESSVTGKVVCQDKENKQVQSKVGYGDTVKVLWGCSDPFSILSLPLSVSPIVHLLLLDACN